MVDRYAYIDSNMSQSFTQLKMQNFRIDYGFSQIECEIVFGWYHTFLPGNTSVWFHTGNLFMVYTQIKLCNLCLPAVLKLDKNNFSLKLSGF